jgi:hypothetical protein
LQEIDAESLQNLPAGNDGNTYRWAMFYSIAIVNHTRRRHTIET